MSVLSLCCNKEKLLAWLKLMKAHCKVEAKNTIHDKFDALLEVNVEANKIIVTTNNSSKPAAISFSLPVLINQTSTNTPPITFSISELISILEAMGAACDDIEFAIDFKRQHQDLYLIKILPADIFCFQTESDSPNLQFASSLSVRPLDSRHEFTSTTKKRDDACWKVNSLDIKRLNASKVFVSECQPSDMFISFACYATYCTLKLQSGRGHFCEANLFSGTNDDFEDSIKAILTTEQFKALSSLADQIKKLAEHLKIAVTNSCLLLFGDSFTVKFAVDEPSNVMKVSTDDDTNASFVVNQKLTEALSARTQDAKNRSTDSVTILFEPQTEKLKIMFNIGKSQSAAAVEVFEFKQHTSNASEVSLSRPVLTAALKLLQTDSITTRVEITDSSIDLKSLDDSSIATISMLV